MRNRTRCPSILIWVIGILWATVAAAGSPPERPDYSRDIKPFLKARCYACHGSLKQEGGLRLDTGAAIRQGGDSGAVVTPGQAAGRLLERVTSNDSSTRMPPEGESLTPQQIATLAEWIRAGATSPENEEPQPDPRRHWSFQPPQRPNVPTVEDQDWPFSPLDAFVAQVRESRNLHPQPMASKHLLFRRISLDLIGLPPARDELQSFMADDSPDALEKAVDRLLASPQYGERWGRHWMDVWRYSDWFGRRYVPDVWNSAPQIWRWRDWIVSSLNSDKGYGQMVAEMLAGDEIAPEDDEAGYATGYLIRNWYALNPNDWMRSNVEHAGKAFLGLTFNCAHCHDHKYDPITQLDYFRLRAFFEPISIRQDRVPGEPDPGPFAEYQYGILRKIVRQGSVRIFDKTADAATWFYTGGDERNRVTERGSIAAGIPTFLAPDGLNFASVKLPPRAWYPGLRPGIQTTVLADLQSALSTTESQIPAIRESVRSALPELQAKLAEAEAELTEAVQRATASGRPLSLAGRQSLWLDATAGRRIVQRSFPGVKAFDDGLTIRFQLQIVSDAHLNFQLAKDISKGMTAGLVAFDHGRILSYQPGTFQEFEVGRYDTNAAVKRFEITLVCQATDDVCQLSIRSTVDNNLIVVNQPVARNGWNPVSETSKEILFDARTGCVVAIDDIELIAPRQPEPASELATARLSYFDFEAPRYRDGRDIVGIDGWLGSSFSQSGAISQVSSTAGAPELKPFVEKRDAARAAVSIHEMKLRQIETKQATLVAEIASVQARIQADRAKYGELSGVSLPELTQDASRRAHEAAVLAAEAEVLAKDQLLATATLKPKEDANRWKEIDTAQKEFAAAYESLEKSRAALADPNLEQVYPPLSPTYPESSTGRRRALVEWLTRCDNPLTARVATNHIWLRHFQSPIVATVYDFGVNGASPTHPALLDWLSVELMERDWSMKHLHRMIVTSHTYAMSSQSTNNSGRELDPENHLIWRMTPGRMESEVIRDSLLAVANRLDCKMGGQELENAQAMTTFRRSVYYCCQPEIDGKSAFGALFDAPEPADCYRRTRSIIPQQALALTNNELIHELSGALAASIWQTISIEQQTTPQAFVVAAHEQILTRPPTDPELRLCSEFLATSTSDADDPARKRESLIRALLNHNDFVSIR
ncbi:PSD1 and planctomycete cytochrome C domain-containing protein [Schlesneria paludicola]|uniref:PSD1 and planctomycete cytochrome C domain-containing protein n=1 Tax=Schlesneria paludicola TaxID=360056 RepID=UPI00029ABE88|nr:PSD1 and planctomycete cytochrome C domain-containing protein [Schlesneria paludicola]